MKHFRTLAQFCARLLLSIGALLYYTLLLVFSKRRPFEKFVNFLDVHYFERFRILQNCCLHTQTNTADEIWGNYNYTAPSAWNLTGKCITVECLLFSYLFHNFLIYIYRTLIVFWKRSLILDLIPEPTIY